MLISAIFFLMQESMQSENKPNVPKPTSHILVLARDNTAPRSSGGEWIVKLVVPIVDLPKPDLLDAQVFTCQDCVEAYLAYCSRELHLH